MTTWDALQSAIEANDTPGLVDLLANLPEAERRELVAPLRAFELKLRRAIPFASGWAEEGLAWTVVAHRTCLSAVAGAGLLPQKTLVGFAARATWGLPGSAFVPRDAFVRVLRQRSVTWNKTFTSALADRLPAGPAGLWGLFSLVHELVLDIGMEPPIAPNYCLNWLAYSANLPGESFRVQIERGPGWCKLALAALDAAGSGTFLRAGPGELVEAYANAATDGLLDRDALLDIVLSRLQRSGRRGDMDGLRSLHDALSPTAQEISARTGDYLPLLSSRHATVAKLALSSLIAADGEFALPSPKILAAASDVLRRPDKGLLKTQLQWLKDLAVREPAIQGSAATTAAIAFGGHVSSDLQQRAVTLVMSLSAALSDSDREVISQTTQGLPADLQDRLNQALDLKPAHAPLRRTRDRETPVAEAPAQAVEPIDSIAELAEEITSYLADAGRSIPVDPVSMERMLAGLVACSWKGPEERDLLAEALQPVMKRNSWIRPERRRLDEAGFTGPLSVYLSMEFAAVLGAVMSGQAERLDAFSLEACPGFQVWRRAVADMRTGQPSRVMAYRLAEIRTGIGYAPVPLLLAAPTHVDGTIDPNVLVDRISRLQASGCTPWARDLAQASLRIPPDPQPELAATLRRFPGLEWAAALAERSRTLKATVYHKTLPPPYTPNKWPPPTESGYRPGRPYPGVRGVDAVADLLPPEWAGVFSLEPAHQLRWDHEQEWRLLWPGMLPGGRDIVAAHAIALLMEKLGRGRGAAIVLPSLAEASGPAGPGLRLALAYGAALADKEERAAAVDALIVLASDNTFDKAAFGELLATMVNDAAIALPRITEVLTEVGRSGQWSCLWAIVEPMLAALLANEAASPPSLGELLALAVEAADVVHPNGSIPGLERLAAKKGPSRLKSEAQRLSARLSG